MKKSQKILLALVSVVGCAAFLFWSKSSTTAEADSFMGPPAPPFSGAFLVWNRDIQPNIVGYHIYYGSASQNYTVTIDAGNYIAAYVPNLIIGQIYFFSLTAYDANGTETPLAPEVSCIIGPPGSDKGAALIAAIENAPGPLLTFAISGTNSNNFQFVNLQSSIDLVNWQDLATYPNTFSTLTYTDGAASQTREFYRLVFHN